MAVGRPRGNLAAWLSRVPVVGPIVGTAADRPVTGAR